MITIYDRRTTDYSGLGLCALSPLSCTVEEQAGGLYQLKMTHPIDGDGKWLHLSPWNVIRAPAPVRETPLIRVESENVPGETVTREIWRVSVRSRLRLRSKPSTATGAILGRYGDGTRVVKLGQSGDWFQVVIMDGGTAGWMHSDYLRYVTTETETLPGEDLPGKMIAPRQTREQLFRIASAEVDDENSCVYVTALHLFYDMAGLPVMGEYAPENVPASQVVRELQNRLVREPGFSVYCNTDAPVSGEYTGVGMASALLENDGIVMQSRARLVRDNTDVFILKDEQRDRGVEIRHGKNLLGAVMTTDVSDVISAVIPVGKNEKGEDLRLSGTGYVESPRAAAIPVFRAKEIRYDVQTKKDGLETDESVREELARLAALEFSENGADRPVVGLDVDFILLENTQEYEEYAALQSVHLYDTVRVVSPRSGIDAKVRVTGYVYDSLNGRYDSVTLGELFELKSGISGFDVASGSLPGSRLVVNSLDGDRLRSATIQYAKIHQAAIQQLNADSVAAVTGRFEEIAAGEMTTASLYASVAKMLELAVKEIDAENIETDSLAAVMGDFVKLYADVAGVDYADIKDLNADEMIFRTGAAGELYIDRLAATSAAMVSAVIGELVLRNADGNYYTVNVQNDGSISASRTYPTGEEIQTGHTDDGRAIVGTTANIQSLNAQSIKAASAVVSEILTDAMTAGSITAGQALIASATAPELYTTAIKAIGDSIDLSANGTIRLLIATNDMIRAWYTFTEDGMKVGKAGSAYATLTDDTGFHILQTDEIIGSFAKRQLKTESIRVGPVAQTGQSVVLRRSPSGGVAFVAE